MGAPARAYILFALLFTVHCWLGTDMARVFDFSSKIEQAHRLAAY